MRKRLFDIIFWLSFFIMVLSACATLLKFNVLWGISVLGIFVFISGLIYNGCAPKKKTKTTITNIILQLGILIVILPMCLAAFKFYFLLGVSVTSFFGVIYSVFAFIASEKKENDTET